jgi:transposase-like protein
VKRKRYPRKFQRMAVERMRTCEDVGELAKELGVTRRCLYKWWAKLDLGENGEESARASTHEGSYRKQVLRLKQLLAEKTLEVDFFKGTLQKIRGSTPEDWRVWRDGIYEQIREVMPLQGGLTIERSRLADFRGLIPPWGPDSFRSTIHSLARLLVTRVFLGCYCAGNRSDHRALAAMKKNASHIRT